MALKTLRERGHLARRMHERAQKAGGTAMMKRYEETIQETQYHISFLERIFQRGTFEDNERDAKNIRTHAGQDV